MDQDVIERLFGMLFPTLDLILSWLIVGMTIVMLSLKSESWQICFDQKINLMHAWTKLVWTWPVVLGFYGPLLIFILIMQFLFRIGAIG